jgi:hypothetical protein
VATKEQYEAVLVKAEHVGLGSLTKQEVELLMRIYREAGSRGNRARRIIDGK